MHGHVDPVEFLESVAGFIGCYYLVLALINAVASFYLWQTKQER